MARSLGKILLLVVSRDFGSAIPIQPYIVYSLIPYLQIVSTVGQRLKGREPGIMCTLGFEASVVIQFTGATSVYGSFLR